MDLRQGGGQGAARRSPRLPKPVEPFANWFIDDDVKEDGAEEQKDDEGQELRQAGSAVGELAMLGAVNGGMEVVPQRRLDNIGDVAGFAEPVHYGVAQDLGHEYGAIGAQDDSCGEQSDSPAVDENFAQLSGPESCGEHDGAKDHDDRSVHWLAGIG